MATPRSTVYISAFLRRHWDQCRNWPKERLHAWVQWFVDHDRCLVVSSRRRILSVTLYRCVHTPEQVMANYTDTAGPVAYIEVTASRDKRGMKGCYNLLREAVGNCITHICWVRAKYGNRFTIIPLETAERHLAYG